MSVTAMIDSIGGACRVNNFLSTLNIKPIDHKNLQNMEKRAGKAIIEYSEESQKKAAEKAFQKEMG